MTVSDLGRRASGARAIAPLAPPDAVVTALSTTPVKGLRVAARGDVALERHGASDNRRFYLIDERSRMVNGKRIGILSAITADYDATGGKLSMTFPDGVRVDGTVSLGEGIVTRFFSRTPTARLVLGPWSHAISTYVGRPLRLVEAAAAEGVDRGSAGAVSLISRASVAALEAVAGDGSIDARRFRMLVEVDGPSAHEEDRWVGRRVRIGSALVLMRGHVGRCLVTTQDPDTGVSDLPTLDLLGAYRRGLATTEPLAFGIFGEVLEEGRVHVGDAVALE